MPQKLYTSKIQKLRQVASYQPRFRDSSYHQFRSIHPSKSVISMEDPDSMMKLSMPVGVQSANCQHLLLHYEARVGGLVYRKLKETGQNASSNWTRSNAGYFRLTVVQTKGVAHLMEQDRHARRVNRIHEGLPAQSLTPVTTSAPAETVSKPEGVVVVAGFTARALAVVAALVEEAAAGREALGRTIGVGVGVDIDVVSRALEEALVLNGPSNYIDDNVTEGESIVAI